MNFCVKVDPSTSQPYLSTPLTNKALLKNKALLMDTFADKGTACRWRNVRLLDTCGGAGSSMLKCGSMNAQCTHLHVARHRVPRLQPETAAGGPQVTCEPLA